MTKILVINGHPDKDPGHFLHAAADAYVRGATSRGHEVQCIDIAKLDFPLLHTMREWEQGSPCADITTAQAALKQADHLVLLYPLWLGDVPAILKGFLEQVMRPDFAFRYRSKGLPEKLLAGRSARVVVSMGMPSLFYGLFYRSHSLKSLKRNILGFVGFSPVRHSIIGAIEGSAGHRAAWLRKLERLGERAR
jgi:putative NADPH-quinone reductase